MPNMVTLKNGQMVDENHPLYKQEQQGVQGPGLQAAGTPASAQAPGLQPAPAPAPAAAQSPQTTAAPAPNAQGWVQETLNGMAGYRNPSTGQWLPGDHPAVANTGMAPIDIRSGQPTGQPSGGPAPAPGQTPPAPPGQGANTPIDLTKPPTTVNEAFRQSIMQQLTKPVGEVNKAEFDPQMNAFKLQQQRSQERAQNTLAEQHALEGTNTSGGFLSDKLGLEQARGESEGAFAGQLVGQQFAAQRQQLMQAMQLAQQYGTVQDQLALQDKLAQLDLAMRQRGLDLQATLGQGDLSLRGELGRGQLNLGMAELLERSRQANNNLGFSYTDLQARMNRDAILAALGA